MIIGGLETTQYALEEQAQLLCEHPGLFQQLRADRAKVRPFTEEALRMRSPTHGLSTRATSQDEVFQGVEVPERHGPPGPSGEYGLRRCHAVAPLGCARGRGRAVVRHPCSPHSVLARPAQRPARASSPGAALRVQGAQPIDG